MRDCLYQKHKNFYPRSPCGERPASGFFIGSRSQFLSTLSLRRATWPGLLARPFFIISIHALLAESDSRTETVATKISHFYPRSPCGERPGIFLNLTSHTHFYPRSPCGERPSRRYLAILGNAISIHALLAESDALGLLGWLRTLISIHALLAESDCVVSVQVGGNIYFYPRSPCGERPRGEHHANSQQEFLSTLSLRRATDYYAV